MGRYARELVRALVRLEDGPALALLELAGGPRRLDGAALGLASGTAPLAVLRAPVPRRLLAGLWRLGLGVDRLLGGVDVFHDVRREPLPVCAARRTWALSELPAPGSPAEAELRAAAREIDLLLTFSQHGARELARRLDFPPERVRVTPVGAEHFRRDLGAADPAAAAEPPYVLALGALTSARRPLTLLAAIERLRAGGAPVELVLAGRAGDAADELAAALASRSSGWVTWLRAPTETELPGLIARASALCHLSRGELTAVTPLEALALGVPVVASRLPAFEEVLGAQAELLEDPDCDPSDGRERVEPLAEALARALASRGDAGAITARRSQAAPFTWEACARATLGLWRELADTNRPRAERDATPGV